MLHLAPCFRHYTYRLEVFIMYGQFAVIWCAGNAPRFGPRLFELPWVITVRARTAKKSPLEARSAELLSRSDITLLLL